MEVSPIVSVPPLTCYVHLAYLTQQKVPYGSTDGRLHMTEVLLAKLPDLAEDRPPRERTLEIANLVLEIDNVWYHILPRSITDLSFRISVASSTRWKDEWCRPQPNLKQYIKVCLEEKRAVQMKPNGFPNSKGLCVL